MISDTERSVMPDGFKFNDLVGDKKLSLEEIKMVRDKALIGNVWVAFQNHDMSHRAYGNLLLLRIGPNCSIKKIPTEAPDSPARLNKENKGWGLGWRFRPVGFVDPMTGDIHSS